MAFIIRNYIQVCFMLSNFIIRVAVRYFMLSLIHLSYFLCYIVFLLKFRVLFKFFYLYLDLKLMLTITRLNFVFQLFQKQDQTFFI